MLKRGPKVKLPELRVPGFLLDLYHDLRQRHLLPLVAVLAVAIVAVPFALGGSSGSAGGTEGGVGVGLATSSASPTGAKAIVVAKSAPGLRDYRRRLSDLRPKDPFKQQYAAAEEAGATSATSGAGEAGEGGEGGSATSTGSSPSAESTSGDGGKTTTVTHELKYYSYAIDVRVVPVSSNGVPSKAEPSVRRDLPELTMLPSRQAPALVFIGPSADGKKTMMLVSSNVKSMFGDGVCAAGGETCELLALEPGVPETIVYGDNERVFRIELLKIRLVTTDHLDKAPLGVPQKKGN